MSFLTPGWLWLLPVWPLIFALHWRREAVRGRAAPDFVLWERAARKVRGAARRETRLRDLPKLVPVLLLNLALGQPEIQRAAAPAPVVLIVDRSASMATESEGTTRFARGLLAAERISGARSLRRRYLPPPPAGAPDPPAPSGATVTVADLRREVLAELAAGAVVCVVTDLEMTDVLPAEVGVITVADEVRNAGIVAAGWRDGEGLLIRVAGDAGAPPRRLRISDADSGQILTEFEVVAPTEARFVVRPADVRDRDLRLDLLPHDALALDDVVELARSGGRVRVSMPAEGWPSLERALRASPAVDLTRDGDAEADLRVGAQGRRATLLVAPFEAPGGLGSGPARHVVGVATGAGALAGFECPVTDWPGVMTPAELPVGVETLVVAGGVPLVVRKGDLCVLYVDPDATAWPKSSSWPLFCARLLDLLGFDSAAGARVARCGESVALPSRGAEDAVYLGPDRGTVPLRADAAGLFRIVPDQPGRGMVAAAGSSTPVTAAVLSESESRGSRRGGAVARAATSRDLPLPPTPLQPWLAALALVIIVAMRLQSR